MKFKFLAITALAAASLGISGIASANLLTNGDFETGTFIGWTASGLTCSGVGAGYSAATSGCFGYDADPGAHGGTSAAYLGTAAGGGIISQSFATAIGDAYLVDFYLAIGAYNQISAPNALTVNAGGSSLLSLTDAAAQGFAHYTYQFIATSSTSSLVFTHANAPSFLPSSQGAVLSKGHLHRPIKKTRLCRVFFCLRLGAANILLRLLAVANSRKRIYRHRIATSQAICLAVECLVDRARVRQVDRGVGVIVNGAIRAYGKRPFAFHIERLCHRHNVRAL